MINYSLVKARVEVAQGKFSVFTIIALGGCFIFSQVAWQIAGADRAFSNAPGWISAARFSATALFLCGLFSVRNSNRNNRNFHLLTTWFFALLGAWGLIVDGIEGGISGLNSYYFTYPALALVAFSSYRYAFDYTMAVTNVLRMVCYGSLMFAVVKPALAFGAGEARFESAINASRLSGVVGDANTLSFLALLLICAVSVRRGSFWLFDLASAFSVLFLAQTRFSLVMAIVVVAVSVIRRRARFLRSWSILAAFGLAAFGEVFAWSQKLNSASSDGSDFWNTRLLIWNWALSLLPQIPTTGFGLDKYYTAVRASGYFWVHAHNQVLQDLLIGGVLRAFLSAGVLISLGIWVWKTGQELTSVLFVTVTVLYSVIEVPLFLDSLNFRFLSVVLIVLWISSRHRNQIYNQI